MSLLQGGGAIVVEAAIAGGRVRSAAIRSSRPIGLARVFLGRDGAEGPALAKRLFALCAHSQGAASRLAVAAAGGAKLDNDALAAEALRVFAERVFESLRACVTGWPWGEAAEIELGRAAPALRDAAAAARGFASGDRAASRAGLGEALGRLERAAAALGVPETPGDAPGDASLFGAMRRDCERTDSFSASPPDPLGPDDDRAVVAALASAPAAFAASPTLEGRIVETGAFARLARALPQERSVLAARLAARLADIRLCLEAMRRALRGDAGEAGALVAGEAAPRLGYGAVESARGRLYHLAGLDADGRIASYAILAPTEWNFHASGPFVAAMVGARVGEGEAARRAIARLAALIDPCVAFDIALGEPGHA